MQLFIHLKWFFRRYWHTYTIAMLMLFCVGLINMAIPKLIGEAIDQLLATKQQSATELYLMGMAVGGLLVYLLRYGWRRMLFGTSYKLGNFLRQHFYVRLTKQGQAFYNAHSTGDLMARATNDIDAVEVAAGEGILSGFDGILTFILVLIMMFIFIDWRLAAFAVLPFPFMAVAFYRLSKRIHTQFKDTLDRFSELNDHTQQAMTGIRMIKSMGRESIETQQFDAIAARAADSTYHVQRSEALFGPIIQLSLGAAMLIVLLAGGWQIQAGNLTVGQLTSFTLYLSELIWPMFAFGWLMNIIQRGNAAIERLDGLLNLPDTISDSGKQQPNGYQLTVNQLTFAYPESDRPSLQQVSFTLPEQHTLGIAGATGSGKSTLIQLLMRYWESPDDSIRLGGVPLQQLPLASLRGSYAYVPQDSFLFSSSILENIRMGRSDASDAEVYEAAKLAAIHHDIEQFPDGYHTLVGERGVTLSGGQRQRVSIARALISHAPILILDDALSAVDVATEQQIIGHLRQRQQSVIVISHRLSALEQADEIMVLSHGSVVERGSHQQLSAGDGWYGRMAAYQQMEQAMESSYAS
ncbi:ATP-binding cassette domain-containing protein [Shewanella sp. A3A]|nr:ATP-binding cassette domain-containing protein [Shewanella ferrihydritica]